MIWPKWKLFTSGKCNNYLRSSRLAYCLGVSWLQSHLLRILRPITCVHISQLRKYSLPNSGGTPHAPPSKFCLSYQHNDGRRHCADPCVPHPWWNQRQQPPPRWRVRRVDHLCGQSKTTTRRRHGPVCVQVTHNTLG